MFKNCITVINIIISMMMMMNISLCHLYLYSHMNFRSTIYYIIIVSDVSNVWLKQKKQLFPVTTILCGIHFPFPLILVLLSCPHSPL